MIGKRTAAVGAACVLMAGAVFGYVEVFTKGIDRLPERPCGGAVDRGLAADALPSAGKAEERGRLNTRSDGDFLFACYVRTADSTISGEAQTGGATEAEWREAHRSDLGEGAVQVSEGGVRALALPTVAWVYVPCTPRRFTEKTRRPHSLTVEARTIGETGLHGDALRQVVLDFAYQLARHSYGAGECQEQRKFSEELPRIGSNQP
ncbi:MULTISPECIES: hypothetical protein [unclassified Streptomyces]|uniref:hypothetical protein n=1 Tax=unclassified Streptomyces TaxID=2593676 RepID=UPI00131A8804|nr:MULTISPECIES: hypothetical protein [unclassified Streptomyces]